jgi:hypothetical protein
MAPDVHFSRQLRFHIDDETGGVAEIIEDEFQGGAAEIEAEAALGIGVGLRGGDGALGGWVEGADGVGIPFGAGAWRGVIGGWIEWGFLMVFRFLGFRNGEFLENGMGILGSGGDDFGLSGFDYGGC